MIFSEKKKNPSLQWRAVYNLAFFFDCYKEKLNIRQEKVLKRIIQFGKEKFERGMAAKKYMAITKTSKATATRDLQYLVEVGALVPLERGGRSTRYELNLIQ